MYEYGHLIYSDGEGWVIIKGGNKSEELKTETLVSSLNHLGKDGWEVVVYDDRLGYILKREVQKEEIKNTEKKEK